MNVQITWLIPLDILVTDEFDVLYKEADANDLNNWIIANPTPLPSTTNSFVVKNLKPNTVYRFAVTKSCFGSLSLIDQGTFWGEQCPIISIYQGAPAISNRTLPTLFYSFYYENSTHVEGSSINIFEGLSTGGPACPPGINCYGIVGRNTYQTVNVCSGPLQLTQYTKCNTNALDTYPLNSALTSAVGYYGLDGSSLCCNSSGSYDPLVCSVFSNPLNPNPGTDPILFQEIVLYKMFLDTRIKDPSSNPPPIIQGASVVAQSGICFDPTLAKVPAFSLPPINPDYTRVSGSINVNGCQAEISLRDGTNQTWAPGYQYQYFLEDISSNQIPVTVDANGNPVTIQTNNLTLSIDTYINMTPALPSTQLGPGMVFNLWVSDPGLNNPYTSPATDFTGFTWAQVVAAIAAAITANTSFTATATSVSGNEYIKLAPCTNLTGAYITLTAANLFEGPSDIAQVDPTTAARHGIADAFIYDSGAGEKIYGTRGLAGNNKGLIQVTDLATTSTLEYNHTIDIPINQMTLVDQPPPSTAYGMTHFPDDPNGIHPLTMGIVTSPVWNIGLIYVSEDYDSKIITVYDSANTQVDSYALNPNGPIRYIEVRQSTGEIMVLAEDSANLMKMYLVSHTGIGAWSDSLVASVACNNDVYTGAITGIGTFTVQSSTTSSIKVTGSPGWALNQWSNYRIYITSGPLAGSQAVTWKYDPPLQNNNANDADTLYLDPGYAVTIDASLLSPGDTFVILGETDTFAFVYDSLAPFVLDQYNGYDLVFEDSIASPILAGARWTVENTGFHPTEGTPFLRLSQYNTGGYYAKTSIQNSTISNLLPGATYRVYRNMCGSFFYNDVLDEFYFSSGGGEIQRYLGDGTFISSFQLQDPAGVNITDGAFHITANPATGAMYAIMRGADMSSTGDPYNPLSSKDVYRITALGVPTTAIDGSAFWNETISGRISFVSGKLYFTSNVTRRLFEYNIAGASYTSYFVNASVYKKSELVELIEGAVHLSGNKFVIMNRLENSTVTSTKTKYLFTNLFIYDIVADTIDTVLVGAPSDAYNGAEGTWNNRNLGEMFGEFNGYKDYCYGLSIKTYNGNIYYKQYAEESYYRFEPVAETGVAQIWCIGKNQTSGADASTYRLIRIFNILPTGALVPSVRNIYTYKTARGFKQGPVYIQYSPYYQGVLGVTDDTAELILIDCQNFTGYYGGPNIELANLTFTSYLSINTKIDLALANLSNQIEDPSRFVLDPSGVQVTIFGKESGAQKFNFRVYDDLDIQGPNNSVTNSGNTGTPNAQGLYNTGAYAGYLPVYDSNNNTIWMMGNIVRNTGATEGDRIIKVYNAGTMSVVTTINLTALGAVPTGATHLYWNFFHVPAMDMMVFYGKGNDKLVFIDTNSYTLKYNGPILPIINLNRSPLLGAQNYGWMVPYSNGFYLDRNDNATTDEFWTYIEEAVGGVQYNGASFNWLTIRVNLTSYLTHIDLNSPPYALVGETFIQWKVTNSLPVPPSNVAYWNNMWLAGSAITVFPNEVVEFTQFHPTEQLVSVKNLNTGTLYAITNPTYVNATSLPTFNTLNSIPFFAIQANYTDLNPGDVLEFVVENEVYPNNPFVHQIQINF